MANYFYVKYGLGTRTTGGGTTKQTGSFTALGAAAVYGAIGDANADSSPPVAGDFVLVSNAHSYVPGANNTVSLIHGVYYISVDDANCDTYAYGANEGTTGNYQLSISSSTTYSNAFARGFNFQAGISGTSSAGSTRVAGDSNSVGSTLLLADCKFDLQGTGNSTIYFGYGAGYNGSTILLKSPTLKFSKTSGQICSLLNCYLEIKGGGLDSATAAIGSGGIFNTTSGHGAKTFILGFDFSYMSSSGDIFNSANSPQYSIVADCKLPASFTGGLVSAAPKAGSRYEMYNSDGGNTNYKFLIEDTTGTIKEETTNYLTGGATDGVTPISWKFTTNSTNDLASGGLLSQFRVVDFDSTGSKTISCELLTDGQLTDDDVALEVIYLGNASYPIATIDSSVFDPLATASNLTAGAGTGSWNGTSGLTTPTSSKLSKTVTVNQKGSALVRIVVFKASITLYADPGFTVT